MTDGEERIKRILEKIEFSGSLDPEDLKNLTSWEKDLVQTLYNEGLTGESINFLKNLNTESEFQLIKKKLGASRKTVVPLWQSALKYAAVFIALIASIYYYQFNEATQPDFPVVENHVKLEIENGSIQIINLNKTQEILSATGELIGKQEGDYIKYLTDSKVNELIYNELKIPNGKVFNLELSDGTVVNLNSGTKIRYPVKFLKGKEREVFIEGEAFFDVIKDKEHPFIVKTDDVAITVLGTKFNVTSYKDDFEINTVLVEGSVELNNPKILGNNLVLKPGMKGSYSKLEKSITTNKVDTDSYVGWIKGELIFRNSTFNTIVKTLERKYDVTIENSDKELSEKIFTATFNINIESIEDVLNVISEISGFNYTVNGKHIQVISKPKNL